MAPNTEFVRKSATYEPTYQRFVIKKKNYNQQYSHIYVSRLLMLRDAVVRAVEETQVKESILPKIIDLKDGDRCVIIGTILKILKAKPCLFECLTSDQGTVSLREVTKMATEEDGLVLEDETGRVELIGEINTAHIVTGVILGVRGRMLPNKDGFYVEQVFTPSFPPQKPLPQRTDSVYVALVSGLNLGRNVVDHGKNPLSTHLLMDYLAGRIGNDQDFVSRIVRTIVAGNSIASCMEFPHDPIENAFPEKKTHEQLTLEATPMKNLDELLSSLASQMCVDIMPGENDPSNYTLPQQSFHSCLFPRSSHFQSFRSVTNPYEATIDQVKFLGHAGQPIHSLLQSIFSFNDNNMNTLDCLEKCLEWRHLAPTAPDVLGCFPIEKEDPFVMEECPHVFFAGNQDSFDTRTIKGAKGQQIQLISIPSFDKTSTIVLVDLKDLSCFPLTFN